MNDLQLDGLDGTNPLHVLAAFGSLFLSEQAEERPPHLWWERVGTRFRPRLRVESSVDTWASSIAGAIRAASEERPTGDVVTARRREKAAKTEVKEAAKELKSLRREAERAAKAAALDPESRRAAVAETLRPAADLLAARTREHRELQRLGAVQFGYGPAHIGDVVGVPVETFRIHVRKAWEESESSPARLAQLGALASDACLGDSGEDILPTPFSFGNGASNQFLLKDFRALGQRVDGSTVVQSVIRGTGVPLDCTNLNWDPRDLRSAARRWDDPEGSPKATDPTLNALAFLGLPMVPAVPLGRRVGAVGFRGGLQWPLWDAPLSAEAVRALLSVPWERGPYDSAAVRTQIGVLGVFRAERISVQKRFYFAPATPV